MTTSYSLTLNDQHLFICCYTRLVWPQRWQMYVCVCVYVEVLKRSLLRCWMMWSMVGLKREFMASGLILSIPWDDHFTKSTLGWEDATVYEYMNQYKNKFTCSQGWSKARLQYKWQQISCGLLIIHQMKICSHVVFSNNLLINGTMFIWSW